MKLTITADTSAYLDGMRKVERAMKKQRRRELTTNIIGVTLAVILVAYLLRSATSMVSGAAW